MDSRNERPLAPWEQEQAAAALAELKQSQPSRADAADERAEDEAQEAAEAAALKVADQHLLIQQVDRMIAEKRADLSRMQRLSGPGGNVNARGVVLSELGKPVAIAILLLTIIAIGIALNWMAGQVKRSIAVVSARQEEAPPADEARPVDDSAPVGE